MITSAPKLFAISTVLSLLLPSTTIKLVSFIAFFSSIIVYSIPSSSSYAGIITARGKKLKLARPKKNNSQLIFGSLIKLISGFNCDLFRFIGDFV
jgi:hypothetical protein